MGKQTAGITILGLGTWGMALARYLALRGHDVTAWTRHGDKLAQYDKERMYPGLGGLSIPESISFEPDMSKALPGRGIVVFAVPSVHMRQVAGEASRYADTGIIAVSVAKGIEPDTLLTMTEVIEEEFHKAAKSIRPVALSGPTHAEEVARDLPTTIVAASEDEEAAGIIQDVFMSGILRVYTNTDRRGVELCGALKNISALASGISTGLGYGDNAKAAIITRALRETVRLGEAMGVPRDTFFGLAGVGDLIVTCCSMNSRNNRAGILIGQGHDARDAVREIGMAVEGINALPAAMELARRYNVEMPILFAVDAIVNHGADPGETVTALMMRDKKDENL